MNINQKNFRYLLENGYPLLPLSKNSKIATIRGSAIENEVIKINKEKYPNDEKSWYKTEPLTSGRVRYTLEHLEKDLLKQFNYGVLRNVPTPIFPKGLGIIDIDKDKETNTLEKQVEDYPETTTVETASGGFHLYYELDGETKTHKTYIDHPKVDMLTSNGYAVAPGSYVIDTKYNGKYSGGYKFLPTDMSVAPFPYDILGKHSSSTTNSNSTVDTMSFLNSDGKMENRDNTFLATIIKKLHSTDGSKSQINSVKLEIEAIYDALEDKKDFPKTDLNRIWKQGLTYYLNDSKKQNPQNIKFLKTSGAKGKTPTVRRIGRNIRMIFEEDDYFNEKFRYNSFTGKYETFLGTDKKGVKNNSWKGLEDDIIQEITVNIQDKYPFFDVGVTQIIKNEILVNCKATPVSPPLEFIKKTEWDGEKRLGKWLHKVFAVPDNKYYSFIGRNWLKYLAQRLAKPGCKVDNTLVLQGDQGLKKSMLLRELVKLDGVNYFNETTSTPDNGKDFVELLQGNIIMEFAEGAIMNYKNINKLKSFITEQSDKYRPPYGRNVEEFPRQCVFAMTTNDTEFLKDKTGERRYWIVNIPSDVKAVNVEWMKENKLQLLAEAMTLIDEKYLEMDGEVKSYWNRLIEERKVLNEKDEFIVGFFDSLTKESKEAGVLSKEILKAMKEEDVFKQERIYQKDITDVLTKTLKLEKHRPRIDGKKTTVYFPSKDTPMEHHGDTKGELLLNKKFEEF